MNVLVQVEGGQHDDASSHECRIRSNGSSRADSVSTGHANVHKDHIGTFLPYHRQRCVPIPAVPTTVISGSEASSAAKPERTSCSSSTTTTEIIAADPS